MAIEPKHKHPTLRALRSTNQPVKGKNEPSKKIRSTASLSVKEIIKRRSMKPIIQGRQFKWISPFAKMKEMKVDLEGVKARRNRMEDEIDGLDDETHSLFYHALSASCLLNLSLPFIAFYRSIESKSRSLPLVIHHKEFIIKIICSSLRAPTAQVELCGETILDLLPPLITDLSTLLLPALPQLLTTLIALTAPSPLVSANPKILQRVYDVLGALFRDLGREILSSSEKGGMSDVWEVVRRGLGAPAMPEVDVEMELAVIEPVAIVEESTIEEDDDEIDELSTPVASTSTQPLPPPVMIDTLPRNFRTTPQTRRLLGSAFSYLVRKARSGTGEEEGELEQLFRMMIEDVVNLEELDLGQRHSRGRGAKGRGKGKGNGRGQEEGSSKILGEGLVWVTVETCQAPTNILHSRSAAIMKALFDVVLGLATGADSLPSEIISHTLTTIAQHVLHADAFEAIVDQVLSASRRQLDQELDWNKIVVIMKAVETVVGVKKGGRIAPTCRPKLFTLLSPLSKLVSDNASPPSNFLQSYTSMTVAVLLLAGLQDVLSGGGKTSVEVLFAPTVSPETFGAACALATSLDEAAWALYSTSITPQMLASTSRYVAAPPTTTSSVSAFDDLVASPSTNSLILLSRLAGSGRLYEANQLGTPLVKSWERTIGTVCETKIKEWIECFNTGDTTEELTHELLDVLNIVPHLTYFHKSLLPLLASLVSSVSKVASNVARTSFLDSAASPAQVLGSALVAFSRIATASQGKESNITKSLQSSVLDMIERFSWHRGVMKGIAALQLTPAAVDSSTVTSRRIYDALLPNLFSEDSLLRLSSLQIAASILPASTNPVAADLIAKCIEVEEMPLSVQGAREKSMKLRKLGIVANGQLGREGEDSTMALGIILRYLTAMMKVNFKPLWPEAIGALVLLSERFPDLVWQICSRQLLTAATRDSGLYVSRKPEWADTQGTRAEEAAFEELELRCHHLEELRSVVSRELKLFQGGEEASLARDTVLIEAQVAPERLTVQSYEAQLLALFCEIPDLAQRHSRDITEVFFGCFQRDDTPVAEGHEKSTSYIQEESAKERKLRLLAWLGLYSKFTNPKALYRADDLASHFKILIAFPDADVQKIALNCLLRWKTPALIANADRLKNLLDVSKLRDELLRFVSETEGGGIDPNQRAEIVPIFIRITYGIMTSRAGRASASSGQGRAGRRAAILGALRTCQPSELNTLVDLTIGPLKEMLISKPGEEFVFALKSPNVMGKRQLGFLGLLADIVKHLGKEIVSRWHDLIGIVLNLLHFAQKGIDSESKDTNADENDEDEAEVEGQEEEEGGEEEEIKSAPLRRIRQLGLKRLADFFRLEAGFDYTPYVVAAFPSFLSPRLTHLAAENAQSPSSLLELFVTWANRRDLIHHLVDHDSTLLPSLYGCLTVRNVKPAVILRVFDVVGSFLEFAVEDGGKDSEIGRTIVQPGVNVLLIELAGLFASTSGNVDAKNEVGQRQITLLCSLAPYVVSQEQAANFLTLVIPMLRKANKTVPEKIKTELLKIMTSLFPLARPPIGTPLYDRCSEVISNLFSSTRTRGARLQLVAAFIAFASVDPEFAAIGTLIEDLNSFSAKRSEEPDFDRRLAAYSLLNENIWKTIRPVDWVPIINNMLFFIQDPEELAIRSNAAFALRRFVEIAGSSELPEIRLILVRVFLPGLRRSLHSKLEIVRAEILGVYAVAVEKCTGVPELDELKCLLVDGDQEANFFYNINHIQVHRRTRALRRLADEVEAGAITSKVVAEIFAPLLDQFILGSDEKKDPDLVNETVQCLGRLSKHLVWSAYNKLAQHYLKQAKIIGSAQKACVRTLVVILKGFHFDLEADPRLLEITTEKLLSELLKYLEKREEIDEEIRIPIAEGISAVVQHLPVAGRSSLESSLLMALAQILRSKDQHTRDLTRLTLCNIAASAGINVLPSVVKELRRALQRGPQLHVLAFTVHAILVRLAANPEKVDFDGALHELVPVLGDDVFGTPAKDRLSQEFRAKTKFREVRSFKSLDSFQLLAQTVSPHKISALLTPIRDLLQRTDSAKAMKDVDEVFKRLALGLTMNDRLDSIGLLDLCQSLISQNANFLRPARVVKKGKRAAPDYHVQLSRNVADDRDFFAKNAHRFVSFGLDLFNSAFRKSQFDLDSPITIARLEPLVSLVGNTLYSDDPTVLARSMRATAALIRCPLASVSQAAPVLVKQMLSIVQRAGSTESELAQSSLRTLAIVIRDCKTATLREDQLTELLQIIGPDLEEADRQATLFQLLRSIMARKFVAPEIYDLMDKVAEILVTNQSSGIREVCRAVYLQFLMDYPQGRGRLKASLAFLAKNLSFVHESGRLSVLELISAILTKFATGLLQESAELFFVGLTMVVANDDSSRCREMAAELIKLLFTRIESDTREVLFAMLHAWSSKKEQPQLSRTAIQLFGIAIESLAEDGRDLAPAVVIVLTTVLKESDELLREAEEGGERTLELDTDWQLPYQALQSLSHVYKTFPDLVAPNSTTNRNLWQIVRGHLLFPHIWIRTSSARLLGSLYASSSTSISDLDLSDLHPLSTLSLLDAAQKGCLQLKSPLLSESLAMQVVKNLFFAAKCFDARRIDSESSSVEVAEVAEEGDDAEERKADPLRWLFTRLSYQARAAHTARPSQYANKIGTWSLQPSSVLKWFAAVITHLDKTALERFLVQIVTPIYRISEDPNNQDPQLVELQTLATEVQEVLQAKIGTTAYSAIHNQLRQAAAVRRNERKTQNALAVINDPAEDAKKKQKRNELKTKQKKRKATSFAENKIRFDAGDGKKRRS